MQLKLFGLTERCATKMTARTRDLESAVMLINSVVQPNPTVNAGRYILKDTKVGVRRMYILRRYLEENVLEDMTEQLDLRGMKLYLNGFLYGLYAKK